LSTSDQENRHEFNGSTAECDALIVEWHPDPRVQQKASIKQGSGSQQRPST